MGASLSTPASGDHEFRRLADGDGVVRLRWAEETGAVHGVTPLDLPTYIGVAAVFATVAALACLAPSIRASRINPLIAFRAE